eukprot:gb/GEZN01002053.1/.p1 GENE.gb/GEZN01002053.1/~~gb/GEZN01002053.1/.p1  ORF type:complete len:757 (+),score=134.91 gb/GEZN01002053.1/:87-2357(+)
MMMEGLSEPLKRKRSRKEKVPAEVAGAVEKPSPKKKKKKSKKEHKEHRHKSSKSAVVLPTSLPSIPSGTVNAELDIFKEAEEKASSPGEKGEGKKRRNKPKGKLAPRQATREADKLLAINPGSLHLKIGLATSAVPQSLPMVIAARLTDNELELGGQAAEEEFNKEQLTLQNNYKKLAEKRETKIKNREKSLRKKVKEAQSLETKSAWGPMRAPVGKAMAVLPDSIALGKGGRASGVIGELAAPGCESYLKEWAWTDVSGGPAELVGVAALRLPPSAPYRLRWPIKRGRLDLSNGRTMTQAMSDLYSLISTALTNNLNLTKAQWAEYSVSVALPDAWNEREVFELVQLLLVKMGFKEVLVQLESVFSCFGAGVATACVVDVGAGKTSVCAVHEGLVVPGSLIHMPFGGHDLTQLLQELLIREGHAPPRLNTLSCLVRWQERLLLGALREQVLHFLHPDSTGGKQRCSLYIETQDAPCQLMVPYAIAHVLTPEALFEVDLLPLSRDRLEPWSQDLPAGECYRTVAYFQLEDPIFGLLPPSGSVTGFTVPALPGTAFGAISAQAAAIVDQTLGGGSIFSPPNSPPTNSMASSLSPAFSPRSPAMSSSGTSPPKTLAGPPLKDNNLPKEPKRPPRLPLQPVVMALHHAVTQAISTLASVEVKKAMAQHVLLVGAASKIAGLVDSFEDRLIEYLPVQEPSVDRVEIMPVPKGCDPGHLPWKGAAFTSGGDGAKDCWISAEEWKVYGLRALRDRLPFLLPA